MSSDAQALKTRYEMIKCHHLAEKPNQVYYLDGRLSIPLRSKHENSKAGARSLRGGIEYEELIATVVKELKRPMKDRGI